MSKEINKLVQIKKAGNVTAKVLKVLARICEICTILVFIASIVMIVNKDQLRQSIDEQVAAGKAEVTLDAFITLGTMKIDNPLIKIDDSAMQAIVASWIGIVGCALVTVVLYILRRMFISIADSGTPFTEDTLKKLRVVGIIVPILVLTQSVIAAAIVALTFWCLYTVFDYGCVLQKNADETL